MIEAMQCVERNLKSKNVAENTRSHSTGFARRFWVHNQYEEKVTFLYPLKTCLFSRFSWIPSDPIGIHFSDLEKFQ